MSVPSLANYRSEALQHSSARSSSLLGVTSARLRSIGLALFVVGALTAVSRADVLQIAYNPSVNGKTAKSHDFSFFNGKLISPDTLQFGTAFSIRPFGAYANTTACNRRGEMGLQILAPGGIVYRKKTRDTNWVANSVFPVQDSLAMLDSVPGIAPLFTEPSNLTKSPGYVIGKPGDRDCQWDNYDLVDSVIHQLIFVKVGAVYAKLKITGYKVTVPGMPTVAFQNNILDTLTVRYVVTNSPSDLGDGPTSIRAVRKSSGSQQLGVYGTTVAFDRYNPLGIRVKTPGRFQATVPRPHDF